MNKLAYKTLILGTGTFAQELADVISEISGVRIAGFVEYMDVKRCEERISNLPVFWVDDIVEMASKHQAICGLGTTNRDCYITQVAKYNIPFATLVHPSARISKKSNLGEGTFVSCSVVIAAKTKLGKHVVVNRGVLIGHHATVGSYVTIGPGANIGGNSQIGDGTYVGLGASVIDHISVGSHSVIGAGAVVIKDVPDRVLVAGVPAKIIKEGIKGK